MIKHVNIKVFGEVQGIGFRYETLAKARSLGLKGFVRNEPDGSVRIEAEGKREDLNKFIEWCKDGPRGAAIQNVNIEFQPELKNFLEFAIEF
jgi:acylphosphatase